MADRWEGYYWVVFCPELSDSWTIGEYSKKRWFVMGMMDTALEDSLIIGEFIGPQRPYQPARTRESGV